jgi:hypothetical protein
MPMKYERSYWYIACKICGNLHREQEPADLKPGLNVKVAGKVECPNSPGKSADYRSTDWFLLTDSEKKEFERNRREQDKK